MAFMQWEEKYQLDIVIIDNQHQRLFELIGNFYTALQQKQTKPAMAEILQGLEEYTLYHFNSEENLMKLKYYPEYEAHRTAHEKFIEMVKGYRDRFDRGILLVPIEIANFLKDWLANHILVTDKQLADFLLQQGIK